MKLSINVIKVVLASTLAFNMVLAQETNSADLQKAKYEEIATAYSSLKSDMTEYKALSEALATAKKSAAGYTVDIEVGGNLTKAGTLFGLGAGGVRYYQEVTKQVGRFATKGKRPTEIVIVIAGVTLIGGIVALSDGHKALDISEANRASALANMTLKEAEMETKRSEIKILAQNQGAIVTENIVSFKNAPAGMQVFGSAGNIVSLK